MLQLGPLTTNLFKNINLAINSGERIGLVGSNGSGKTTLLRLIVDQAKLSIGYVPQALKFSGTVYDYLETQGDVWRILAKLRQVFDFEPELYSDIAMLSGGEQMQLMLSAAICHNPQLLVLDEPTNHLDLVAITRLEQLLAEQRTYIIASHDIAFLDRVTSTTFELAGRLEVYGGNYSFYQQQKNLRLAAQQRDYLVATRKLRKINSSLQQEEIKFQSAQAKLARKAEAGDRSIPRIVRNALKKGGQVHHGLAKQRLTKTAEELATAAADLKQAKRKSIHLALVSQPGHAGLLVSFEDATLANSQVLLEHFDFTLKRNDRISIGGRNGTGKSSLVRQLGYKQHSLISGKVQYGAAYRTMLLDQHYSLIQPLDTLLHNLTAYGISYEMARKYLADLGFYNSTDQLAGTLSGGETMRLALAIITAVQPELLILDEPTNNLDIEAMQDIADCLQLYNGTLVVISHNRQFLDAINIADHYLLQNKSIAHTAN
jgi:ATPase subunit of ABC transporter with duplicated ATPase domains